MVRITGYLLLALGDSLWTVVPGACLTGVGGALFSPSIESLMAQAGTRSEAEGKRSRAEWFALFAVCGELGAVLGPVLGSLMAGFGFKTMALAGAGVFIVALAALFMLLPRTPHRDGPLHIAPWWQTFQQPRFVAFILAYSAYLFSYNQLYLALPVELRNRAVSGPRACYRWVSRCWRPRLSAWRCLPRPRPSPAGCGCCPRRVW